MYRVIFFFFCMDFCENSEKAIQGKATHSVLALSVFTGSDELKETMFFTRTHAHLAARTRCLELAKAPAPFCLHHTTRCDFCTCCNVFMNYRLLFN